ncbi:MAG: hypothetical protein PHT44_00130 [Candidatus Portnoybacteria bacterium]|nr:hypothetical protein [Candidatus Portnoybacteria bacterium]MDD4982972.1 hypothetical protein [Candidatus Portnoybacteria bacterium]
MSFENIRKNGSFCSFIPRRLEIKDRPELNNFPLNVLFAKRKIENGQLITGFALYEPDLTSLKKEGDEWSMNYHNVYGGDCWLRVVYDEEKHSYMGEKFIDGKSVVQAFGTKWDMFFIHFTMLGLANGERCEFK